MYVHQKLVLEPTLILVDNPKQPFHARNSFENKIFLKRIIKKPQKVNFYFFFQTQSLFNPIKYGSCQGCLRIGWGWGGKKPPPPSLKSVTHPTVMKFDTVIPYLKKIQKIYVSCDTPLEFP